MGANIEICPLPEGTRGQQLVGLESLSQHLESPRLQIEQEYESEGQNLINCQVAWAA